MRGLSIVFVVIAIFITSSVAVFPQEPIATVAVAWSHSGNRIAAALSTHQINVIDADSQLILQALNGSPSDITDIAWSHDDSRLATAGRDGVVRVWNPNTGQLLNVLTGHTRSIIAIEWGGDNQRIYSSSILSDQPSEFIEWNVQLGVPIQTISLGDILDIAVHPDLSLVAITDVSGRVRILSESDLAQIAVYTPPSNMSGNEAYAPTWNSSGSLFAVGRLNGTVNVWDTSSSQIVQTLNAFNDGPTTYPEIIQRQVRDLAFAPDDSSFHSINGQGIARVWTTSSWQLEQELTVSLPIYGASWDPTGSYLAYGSSGEIPVITSPVLNTIILSPTPANPLILSEETRAWYNYNITLSATLTGSECVTVRLDYYPPTPTNYAHVQTKPSTMSTWSTAQTLVFDANHTDYEVRIRARDDSTNHTGAVGRLSHHVIENEASGCTSAAGFVVNTVDVSGMRLTGSPFSGGNDASAAADSRNVLVFTVEDND